jgi:hypothetical protein
MGMGSDLPYAIVEVPKEYITKHEDGIFSGRPNRSHISHNDTISKSTYKWFEIFHKKIDFPSPFFKNNDDSARSEYWEFMENIANFYVNINTIEII